MRVFDKNYHSKKLHIHSYFFMYNLYCLLDSIFNEPL